jgi:hypothetical protein
MVEGDSEMINPNSNMQQTPSNNKPQTQKERMIRHYDESCHTDESETFHSPSKRYTLQVVHDEYYEGVHRHAYTRGIVTCREDAAYRMEINRNFGLFPHCWLSSGGREYLLTSQDYQGYTIIDLEQSRIIDYVPEAALEGGGFCWAKIHHRPGSPMLAVEGCYPGAEFEIVFYDFAAPLTLPYREAGRITAYEEALGWTGEGVFAYLDLQGNRKEANAKMSD